MKGNPAAPVPPVAAAEPDSPAGVALGASAFLIWGLSPLYWKMLGAVPSLEIIMHRIVWSFVFLAPIMILQRRWSEFTAALKNRRTMSVMLGTSCLVATNWLLYIWSVNNDRVLEASLGYYINPLVNVLLGMVFLKERLRKPQAVAVFLAGAGVLYLTVHFGVFPWVSLTLAFSFGFYGLVRKVAAVGPVIGLSIETALLSIPALIYLFRGYVVGTGTFLRVSPVMDLTLMGAALVTALPLLLFTMGAKRLHLSTLGFLQYIAPTGMFLLGVFVFGEPFQKAQVVTFIMIWIALGIYSVDSVVFVRKSRRLILDD